MDSNQALKGITLIDCAKASAQQGINTAARLCGYGTDLSTFEHELKQACQDIGVEIKTLTDLITDKEKMTTDKGLEIAPDTLTQI